MDDLKRPLLSREEQAQDAEEYASAAEAPPSTISDDDDTVLVVKHDVQSPKQHLRAGRSSNNGNESFAVRAALHVVVVPALFYVLLHDLNNPFLGLGLPIAVYSILGLAVPIEMFLAFSALVLVSGVLLGAGASYVVMLLLTTAMSTLSGYQKHRKLIEMELENQKKKMDDDLDDYCCDYNNNNNHPDTDEDSTDYSSFLLRGSGGLTSKDNHNKAVAVVPPGKTLDALRAAERQRLRERKRAKEQAKKQIAIVSGVPLDSVDCVV